MKWMGKPKKHYQTKFRIKNQKLKPNCLNRSMSSPPKMVVTIVAILVSLGISSVAIGVPNTKVASVLCNGRTYSKADPFAASLDYILHELESVAPTAKDYDLYTISPYPNAFAYGHASCSRSITGPDCGACLGAAKTAMFGTCQTSVGARSVLYDCAIRYEQYPFL